MRQQHVRASSIDCFHDHQHEFGAQEQTIIDYVSRHPSVTRREISKATGIEPGAVAGRVNRLIHELRVLHELPRRECSVTGVSSHCLMLRPKEPIQEAFYWG